MTGVITYSSNLSTSQVIQNLLASTTSPSPPRILLETDAPYMIPANLYSSLPPTLDGESLKGRKLPLCHTAMIPWVAEFVADVANGNSATDGVTDDKEDVDNSEENTKVDDKNDVKPPDNQNERQGGGVWTADRVMCIARENTRRVYGI